MSDDLYRLLGGATPENNLAEDYAGILDYIGRLAGAVEDGKLHYAWEKAGQLRRVLEKFEDRLQETIRHGDGETTHRFTGQGLDGQKVALAAVAFAQDQRAGRLLHPVDQITDNAVKAQLAADAEAVRAFHAEMGA